MFTGLIECTGTVVSLRRRGGGARLTVSSSLGEVEIGASIAVNGVCQTVAERTGDRFSCDVLAETLRVSTIGLLRSGSPVNLERALGAGGRFGGHIVNGHIDGMGTVARVSRQSRTLSISAPREILRYLVPKGSVAVDGVSLTVGPDTGGSKFDVYIIPHTWEHTSLGSLRTGAKVNIEIDILAKYVERFVRRMRGDER
jgi:riboflavin synthase